MDNPFLGSDWVRIFLGFGIVIVSSLLILAFIVYRTDRRWVLPVLAVYVAHLTIGLALTREGPRGNDAQWYDRFAWQTVRHWEGNGPPPSDIFDDRAAFIRLTASFYQQFGHSIAPMIALNALAITLTVLTAAHIVRLLGGNSVAVMMALWSGLLMPGLMVWTKDLLREPYVFLFTLLACYGVIRATQGKTWLMWTVIPLLSLYGFRAETALILAIALVPALLTTWRTFPATLLLLPLTAVAAIPIVAFAASAADSVSQRELTQADLGSTAIQPASDLLVDPLTFLRVLAGPFPWEWSGPLLLLGIDAVFCWALLRYSWECLRHRRFTPLLTLGLPFLLLIVATSIGAYNYGLAVRIRGQAYVCLIPLAAIGWQHVRLKRHGRSNHPRLQSAELQFGDA